MSAFKSFLGDLRATTGAVVTRCNTPLGRFELEMTEAGHTRGSVLVTDIELAGH
jgi:hypothetical protein